MQVSSKEEQIKPNRRMKMAYYEILARFAKSGAPSFRTAGYPEYLEEARRFFNMKSLLATNPKEMLMLDIVDDETIRMILKSERELELAQASRSLRVFSMYLIDRTHEPVNFSGFITGKRLFRTQTSVYDPGSGNLRERKEGGREGEGERIEEENTKDREDPGQREYSDENLLVLLARLIYEEDCVQRREKIEKVWEVLG
jgi:hypothetical protein